jgi:hypothetical protein
MLYEVFLYTSVRTNVGLLQEGFMTQTRRKLFSVISVVLSLLMVISVISFPTLNANADGSAGTLDDFVERCYTVTLDRPSDPPGFADWKDQLLNGKAVGIEIAYGFLFSREYVAKNKDNDAYLKDLYMLFMGREPDESGYNDWMNKLNSGVSRLEVFAGFANSTEFYNICDSYGITAGRYVMGYDRKTINNVNLYVERMYKICLGRIGDKDGQKDWVEKLIKKEISGSECARSFIFSQEYINKGLSDEDFVENLYLAMFGRPSDADGKYNWLFALKNGMTRDEVFAGFANSIEFDNICKAYGINRGSYTAKDKGTYNNGGGNGEEGDDNTASGNNTLGEHTHVYGIQNTSPEYLKSLATCTTPATYYYSCKCGAKGTETFTRGEPLGHNYVNKGTDAKYLKTAATCTKPAVYYMPCSKCGKCDAGHTFTSGEALGHQWEYSLPDDYIKEPTLTEKGSAKAHCVNDGCNETKIIELVSKLDNDPIKGYCPLGGKEVTFGKYEQDGDLTNGPEDIVWIVGRDKDGKRYLLSKYALDYQPFHTDHYEHLTTWETSTIREWLNNDFKNAAFSSEELKWLAETTVEKEYNPYWDTSGYNDTKDYVFIPSMGDIYLVTPDGYNHEDEEQKVKAYIICEPTQYAINKGATCYQFTLSEEEYYETNYGISRIYQYKGTNWWIRDPGISKSRRSYCTKFGAIGKNYYTDQDDFLAVRPMICLDFEK